MERLPVVNGQAEDLIRLESITKVYGSGDAAVAALTEFSMSVKTGELLAVMGPSGSGKSTLMNILGCLDTPTSGSYWFAGQDVSRLDETELAHVRNRRIGFVFQQFQLLPKMSAWRNVELPLLYRNTSNRRDLALQALDQVGLSNRVNHRPTQLSGGQQQRVAIARALVTNPDLILADEPTGNLDTAASKDVLAVLRELNEQGRTIIIITHDPEVAPVAHRTVSLRDGRMVQDVAA
ncbi:MAG TPA: ABC transporter ATP-binding protein [Candidatus Dormibacteraeota bacterium]|nr:ABC transporter ATP-binding protein [Candidatus Dormibacteraeota bacterium]